MTDVTRQQRRKAHREYIKLGRAALATGLSPRPQRETVLGVALIFKAKLTEPGNARRAGEAAGMAQALIESSSAAVRAAEARNADRLFAVGGEMYSACLACHENYMSGD